MILYNDMYAMYAASLVYRTGTAIPWGPLYGYLIPILDVIGYLSVGAAGIAGLALLGAFYKKTQHQLLIPFVGMAITSIASLLIPERIEALGILNTAALAYGVTLIYRLFHARCLDGLTRTKERFFSRRLIIRVVVAGVLFLIYLPYINTSIDNKAIGLFRLLFNRHSDLLCAWNVLYFIGLCVITIPAYLEAAIKLYGQKVKSSLPAWATHAIMLLSVIPLILGILVAPMIYDFFVFPPILRALWGFVALVGEFTQPYIAALVEHMDPKNYFSIIYQYTYWRFIYLLCSVATVVILGKAIGCNKKPVQPRNVRTKKATPARRTKTK